MGPDESEMFVGEAGQKLISRAVRRRGERLHGDHLTARVEPLYNSGRSPCTTSQCGAQSAKGSERCAALSTWSLARDSCGTRTARIFQTCKRQPQRPPRVLAT